MLTFIVSVLRVWRAPAGYAVCVRLNRGAGIAGLSGVRERNGRIGHRCRHRERSATGAAA